LKTGSRCPAFPIRQAVASWARVSCWEHLATVLGGATIYSGSITLIIIYSAIYLAIGGRDGMDGSGAHWMTCSIYRTHHQLSAWGFALAVGDVGNHLL
jgi:hypothetical protein